jgi:hypothetical protein
MVTAILERPSSLGCLPRWTTPRTPERKTRGGELARFAAALGTPLMPWQRHVADVALEQDPGTGLLVFRRVVLTVPRQSGKTTLLLAKMVHRAQGFGPRQVITYTAQTRLKARKKWEDEHVPILERSPFRPLFTVRKQIGQEAIRWRNGSLQGLDAPTEESGHGDTLDEGVIDEAFSQEDARVEQGMAPAMITRPQPQLDVVSTAGKSKARSPYLWGKVEAGRLAAEAGLTTGTAYFEWSAPNDADPADPATWWGCMPALGWTVTEEAVRSEFQSMELAEFRRAYLNQWVDEAPQEWLVIGREIWSALADPRSQIADRPAFAVDVTPDRTWAAIGAAGCRADGLSHVEVVEHRRGTSWVVPWLKERVDRADRWSPCAIVIAPSGPAGSLITEAEAVGLEILKASVRDIAHGCGALYDAAGANPNVEDPAWLRHLDQVELNAALAGAQRRDLGEGWLWTRKGLTVDISPLVSATEALWGHAARGHQAIETTPEPDIF